MCRHKDGQDTEPETSALTGSEWNKNGVFEYVICPRKYVENYESPYYGAVPVAYVDEVPPAWCPYVLEHSV